jgi:Tol biopolymer transport system component/DNA-binding winged helix-turn-helix (wHTH) protein
MHERASATYQFGPFRLDLVQHRLLCAHEAVPLTPKVFDVLRILVLNSGRLVLKEDLIAGVWAGTFVEEANLNRCVSVLRAALRARAPGEAFIETVPKRGYRFVAPVEPCPPRTTVTQVAPAADRHARLGWIAAACALAALPAILYVARATPDRAVSPDTPASLGPRHRQITFTGRDASPAVSPDGARLAYVSGSFPDRLLIVEDLATAHAVEAFRAPEIGNLRWSPDGTELLFFARGGDLNGVYRMSASGGTPRVVARGLYSACWSPDGSTVAVAIYGNGRIGFIDARGQKRTIALSGVHAWTWDIDWSPTGDRLLVVTDDGQGRHTIWIVHPDGSGQQRVYEDRVELRSARWAPDGRAIYFARRDDQTVSLFKMTLAGGRAQPAVARPVLDGLEMDGAFTLAADGRRLAYARAPYHSNLWALDIAGSGQNTRVTTRQLTHGTWLVERPNISPDGASVVFNIGYNSRANLFLMPVAGGAQRQLTFLDAFSVGGVWSPDGRLVAFGSTEGGEQRVWLADSAGGPVRRLSRHSMSESFALAWFPDGRVLYQLPGNRDFLFADPGDGFPGDRLLGGAPVGWVFSPVASPNGRRIAVAWNQPAGRGLWILDRLTGERRYLDWVDHEARPLAWAADGRSIFAVSGRPGHYRGLSAILAETILDAKILEVPLHQRAVRTVVTLPFEEVGGVSITPDGRTVVCAVYSSRSDVWMVEHFDAAASREVRR